MRHCEKCGAVMQKGLVEGRKRPHCKACGFVRYRNPAPVGLAVVEHAGVLVLIRRAVAPLAGYWAPPSGYVEYGESITEAVIREVREETSLEIVLDGLTGVYSQADVDVILIAYRAHSVGGGPRAGDDAAEIGLFARGQMPREQVPATGTAVERWFYGVIQDVTASWR